MGDTAAWLGRGAWSFLGVALVSTLLAGVIFCHWVSFGKAIAPDGGLFSGVNRDALPKQVVPETPLQWVAKHVFPFSEQVAEQSYSYVCKRRSVFPSGVPLPCEAALIVSLFAVLVEYSFYL